MEKSEKTIRYFLAPRFFVAMMHLMKITHNTYRSLTITNDFITG
jgi:hypothetical protein